MDNEQLAKKDIMGLLSQTYGWNVFNLFQVTHGNEVLPIFVHNSFLLLKENMGKYKATEQLDLILSKRGVSVATYE